LNITDIIRNLLKYRKFVFITTFSVGLIMAFYVYVILKPIYLSTGTVKTTFKPSSLSGLLSGSGVGDLSGLTDFTGGSSIKELSLFENILISRRNIEETIIKYNLNSEWEFKYNQDAIKFFREDVLEITKDKIAGTLEIGIYDTDPQRAKDIADFMIFQLNKINTEMNVQNAKSNREFIEARYKQLLNDLSKAEDSLNNFQKKYGIAPDITFKAVSQAAIQLEAEIKSEEIKLSLLKNIYNPEEPEVLLQQNKINALRNQLQNINTEEYDVNDKLKLKGAPDVLLNYYRLQKEVEIQNKIQSFLLPLYEQAKIEEKKEMPTVIVLDSPNLPEKKVKPQRVKMILISMFIAFSISLFSTMFLDKVKRINIPKLLKDEFKRV